MKVPFVSYSTLNHDQQRAVGEARMAAAKARLVTVPVDQLFAESNKPGSITQTLQDVYYKKPSEAKLLSEVTEQKQSQYEAVLDQAVAKGVLAKDEAARRHEDFVSGNLGPYSSVVKPKHPCELLGLLNEMESDQFALVRQPQQCADGLYRPMDFFQSPGQIVLKGITRGWEMSKTSDGVDLPVADVVVVGAGPGGLATSLQLARRGGRVVCFESELAGSNFNDGGAKAVHHMRTSVDLTNIVREGDTWATINNPLSLSGSIPEIRPLAQKGRQGQTKLTGEEMHGVPLESLDLNDRTSPATRGELWEHLSQVASSLANDYPDAILCERSPVSGVSYENGLFTVTTTRGHKVKCKELVLSTGLTGSRGEQARSLKILDDLEQSAPDKTVVLQKISDTQSEARDLTQVANGQKKATLIVNDRLLGEQSFRQTYAALPGDCRAAIIGSGESAIKGALEMAHLNPGLKVDLFVKSELEAAQVQLPTENFNQRVMESTLEDPVWAQKLADMYKVFDTPVAPRSLQEIFELQQSGRVRVVELGTYFDENSIALASNADGSTHLDIKDAQALATVAKNEASYQAKGLMSAKETILKGADYVAIVQAAGYNKLRLADHPLAQLPAEAQAKIHANTISNSLHPAQSALPGLGTAGRHLAEDLAKRLVPDDRRIDFETLTGPSQEVTVSPEEIEGTIKASGLYPGFVDRVKAEMAEKGSSRGEGWLTFPSQDSKLRSLLGRPADQLSAAEKEVLERGLHLQKRLAIAKTEIY
jgi:hypothetical protein